MLNLDAQNRLKVFDSEVVLGQQRIPQSLLVSVQHQSLHLLQRSQQKSTYVILLAEHPRLLHAQKRFVQLTHFSANFGSKQFLGSLGSRGLVADVDLIAQECFVNQILCAVELLSDELR